MLDKRALLSLVFLTAAGCGQHESPTRPNTRKSADTQSSTTAGIRVIKPVRRDLRLTVVQPGTLEAFEVTSIYSRIAGYVEKYRYNIGDRVKEGDILIDMWIPDVVAAYEQKTAAVKKADVQVSVAKRALQAAEASVKATEARIVSARAGVKRAQASYTRWESEYKRLQSLVTQRVLDVQVRDETYRQFEEAAAARDQSEALVDETNSDHERAIANRDRAVVDVDAARADLDVARADERLAKVNVDYGKIKAPYAGVITQRNVSPGDYLQPGVGIGGRPLFVLEQTDPVRVFVGVPELASFFIKVGDTALIRFQAIPGATREGKIVRTGFSLNPTTRTLQSEIDIPNIGGHLHPGWYVTVTVKVDRKDVWTLPSDAVGFEGQQNYFVYMDVSGKPVKTPIIIGASDDTHVEVLRKYDANANTIDWPELDGTERIYAGNLTVLNEGRATRASGSPAERTKAPAR
jgi:RND family efflux transporter MFP subunit